MYKTIVGIEGMACGMCEEHICSTIKRLLKSIRSRPHAARNVPKSLPSFRSMKKAVRDAIAPTGYEVTSFACVEEAPKKGFFAKLFG